MSRHTTILVTGAAGFIGSHVTQRLLAQGHRVVGLDNFDPYYPRERKLANLREATREHADAFALEECDLTDALRVRACFERHRPASVIHLAGKAGVRPSIADPAGYMHANVTGTQVLLLEASRAGCDRVVLASSSSVYGDTTPVPFREDADVSRPISPYAASKRACELLAATHHHLTGLPIASLRFFTVYGPRQRPDLAIALFLARIARGEHITMFGDGGMSRDFTYIDDIVQGVLAAHDRIPVLGLRTWNLGHHQPVVLRDMITIVERVVGRPARIEHKPHQPGDVQRTYADITLATRELGFAPKTPFEEGVARQWAWMQHAGV